MEYTDFSEWLLKSPTAFWAIVLIVVALCFIWKPFGKAVGILLLAAITIAGLLFAPLLTIAFIIGWWIAGRFKRERPYKELDRLITLRDSGAITEEQFQEAKQRHIKNLLGNQS